MAAEAEGRNWGRAGSQMFGLAVTECSADPKGQVDRLSFVATLGVR